MSRTPRQQSESGVYHVYSRGSGRQIIFEDNGDRRMFLDCLEQAISKADATLLAYCLMGNHYHLVLKSDFGKLSEMAHRLNRSYAAYFNREHDRSGHLFQQRFGSQAIDDDAYFLGAIRYVHRNPVEAGMTQTCDYPWSSYGEYLGEAKLIQPELALDMLGGPAGFQEFHAHSSKGFFLDDRAAPIRVNQANMFEVARSALCETNPGDLKSMDRAERDRGLRLLKQSGLSLSQITMLTGISRPTVSRA